MMSVMSARTRLATAALIAGMVALQGARAAWAGEGTTLESPSLLLLVASVAQIVLAAAIIVFLIQRSSKRPCRRCGKRFAKTLDECPHCGARAPRPRR